MTIKAPKSKKETGMVESVNESKTKTSERDIDIITQLLSFSKFSLLGLVLVILSIIGWAILQAVEYPNSGQIGVGFVAIFALALFLGLVVDLLRWRDYTEWGALGAIIAYLGLILVFIPLVFNMLAFLLNISGLTRESLLTVPMLSGIGLSWYEVVMIIGAIIMFFGLTSRATELDRKIVDQFFIFQEWRKAGGIRQALSALKQLIGTIVKGFFEYIWLGIKELGTRMKIFFRWIIRSIEFILGHIMIFFTKTFPKILERSLIGLWNNLHWIGLIAVIIYIIMVDLPIPNADPILIKAELIIIISFFFCLGVLYPQRDRVVIIAKSMRNTVLSGVISAYSMLSGTKLKADDAIFCSRCLRGIEKREFESLKEIKETINPPCPFCGFNNWVGIGVQEVQKAVTTEIPPEEKVSRTTIKGSDAGVQSTQKKC